MSLYGAMYTSVTGLQAQSSAMGAISDNLANVNTTGYKATMIDFASQVTKQVSFNQYAPGGVLSQPRKAVDAQGLLSRTDKSTDLAISGQGFFVVNEAANPSEGDVWAYTRSGAFNVNSDGYLVNSSGFYLQAWPTLPDGAIGYYGSDGSLVSINTNTIGPDNLKPINLKTIGGTASPTSSLRFGANLPANDAVGDSHSSDILIYDSRGNAQNLEFVWEMKNANEWYLDVQLPSGAAAITLYGSDSTDGSEDVYGARGQLEFTGIPADGGQITIDGTVYEFDTNGVVAGGAVAVDVNVTTAAEVATNLVAAIGDARFTTRGSTVEILQSTTGASIAVTVDPNTVTNCMQANANPVAGVATGIFTIPAVDPDFVAAGVRRGAITFNGDGTPARINVDKIDLQWANGAADMEAGATDKRIAVDLGTPNLSDGMTQYSGSYTPSMITQDGAAFGSFTGVEVSEDGIVTALFDNGETRPIYRIPVVTFVNPNGLGQLSGSSYIETDFSGGYTLHTAGEAGAGTIAANSLESSTVDIGEQFTAMIITQRAYSAAAKIVTTADEMLDELIRIKR